MLAINSLAVLISIAGIIAAVIAQNPGLVILNAGFGILNGLYANMWRSELNAR